MGFRNKFSLGCVASVLLCGSMGWTQDRGATHITVLVNDSVGVNRAILRRAETEAALLFRGAGIAIDWVPCAKASDCRRPPQANEFVLHVVPSGSTRSDLVFGEAFLAPDGTGKYFDVFFDRIREDIEKPDVALLLGAVIAHELGHLLLGSHAHSLVGIMEPVWKRDNLQKIAMGNLTFTPEQLRLMRSRLQNRKVAVSSLTKPDRLGRKY